VHDRLFGAARPLDEIEHLTDTGFTRRSPTACICLAGKYDGGERHRGPLADKDGKVEVLVRGRQPRDRARCRWSTS